MDKKDPLDGLFGPSPSMELKLSYSRVSDFYRNGPKCLIKRTFVENDGAKIGSATDDLLYTRLSNDKEYFKERFLVVDHAKPTASLLVLCDSILKKYDSIPDKDVILKEIKEAGLWSSVKSSEVLEKKFNNDTFYNYLKNSYASKTKTILSTEEYLLASNLVDILLTHVNSKDIFRKDVEIICQYKIEYEYNEFKFRGILDFIIIDRENKTVRMIDLKTGKERAENFIKSVLKWRYDLQEAVYKKSFQYIAKDLGVEGYTLLPFQFLYISRTQQLPIVYEVTEKWSRAAFEGYLLPGGKLIKGLEQLVEEIKWHWKNKVFNMSRLVYESNGKVELDDGFIELLE